MKNKMKKLLIIFLISLSFNIYAHESTKILVFKHKCEAKRVQRRFDRAAIYKEVYIQKDIIFIEIEEDDYDEYYNFLFLKRMCIPKRHLWDYTEMTIHFMNASDDAIINSNITLDKIL